MAGATTNRSVLPEHPRKPEGSPNPPPIGEMFPVKIIMENQEPLKFEAEVLWNNINVSADKIIHRGMKVRFLQLSNDDRKTLYEIISTPSRENLFT